MIETHGTAVTADTELEQVPQEKLTRRTYSDARVRRPEDACRIDTFEGWARVRTTVGDTRLGPWELVCLNSSLPARAKLALVPRVLGVVACADVSIEDTPDASGRLADAALRVTAAAELVRNSRRPIAAAVADDRGEPDTGELAQLCEEAGWPSARQQEGKLIVDLETRGGYHSASVWKEPSGTLKASARVADLRDIPEAVRPGIGAALLLAAGAFRMVRAAVYGDGIVFETSLDTASTGDIQHALSALSVACGLSCREIGLLRDDAAAQRYLSTARRLQQLHSAWPSQGQERGESDAVNG
jgi:hypothetical protein